VFPIFSKYILYSIPGKYTSPFFKKIIFFTFIQIPASKAGFFLLILYVYSQKKSLDIRSHMWYNIMLNGLLFDARLSAAGKFLCRRPKVHREV
jgi:hypothetical protein